MAADPVSVSYAVPAATVKHTHAVDADPVSVAYAVPAAAVRHTLPDTHAVNADPVVGGLSQFLLLPSRTPCLTRMPSTPIQSRSPTRCRPLPSPAAHP